MEGTHAAAVSEDAALLRLTDLRVGDHGRFHAADLAGQDREILLALGLAEQCLFRLCKAGDPWIVQVKGTRVGLSDAVARQILVVPETVSENGE